MGLLKRAVLLAKEETTYGTDSVPTAAANALLVFNPDIAPQTDILRRDPVRDFISPSSILIGNRFVEIKFQTEYYPGSAAGSAPRYGDLLEACAMSETVVALVSVTYKPTSGAQKSVTIYLYQDGRLHKITGCVGTFELVFEAGQTAKINWTFRGLYQEPTDVSIPAATYESLAEQPAKVLSSNFTFNALTNLVVQRLAIGLGNVLATRPDVNSATGRKGFSVVRREGKGSINPEAFTLATYNAWTDWINSTLRQLSITVGSGAGKVLTVTCPKVAIENINAFKEREGIEVYEIPFSLAMNTGDDEISLQIA